MKTNTTVAPMSADDLHNEATDFNAANNGSGQ
jgi:hypothetical protein